MSGKYNIRDHVFFIGKLTTLECLNKEQEEVLKNYGEAIKTIFCSAWAALANGGNGL